MITHPAFLFFADGTSGWTLSRGQLVPVALAVAGVIVLTIFSRSRMRKRSSASELGVRNRYRQLEDRNRSERELAGLTVELDQLAREIHGRLETQFAKLETVIRDADDRIDRLTRLLRASRNESTVDVTVASDAEEAPTAPRESESNLHADVYRLADAGRPLLEISEQTGRHKGEIELILALRRARQRSAAASIAAGTP